MKASQRCRGSSPCSSPSGFPPTTTLVLLPSGGTSDSYRPRTSQGPLIWSTSEDPPGQYERLMRRLILFWHGSSAPPRCLKPPYQQSDWEKVGILIFHYEKESITRAPMVPCASVKTALVENIWDGCNWIRSDEYTDAIRLLWSRFPKFTLLY